MATAPRRRRRWTGIEPAGRGSPVPPALKAGEPTRCPDTSRHVAALEHCRTLRTSGDRCPPPGGRSDGEQVARGELAVLGNGERVGFAAGPEGARLVLVAGRPLNEPVAKYGPFVMNTNDEIRQAVHDYQTGKF